MTAQRPLDEVPVTAATDAGMVVLWDPRAFEAVVDHDTWQDELLEDEDVVRHVRAGALAVPGALPDFVVLINPVRFGQGAFRTAVQTFEAPNG